MFSLSLKLPIQETSIPSNSILMASYANLSSVLVLLALLWGSLSFCEGFGTFGFDVHHRYSDHVKGVLDLGDLPEKGSLDYYGSLVHRDQSVRGRHLAGTPSGSDFLTFAGGNDTYRISSLGYLHYANVSVGSPSLWFLVALDTGSDLFWLPCDCSEASETCVQGLLTRSGKKVDLNIYSPNTSSTSNSVSCNSTFCRRKRQCSPTLNTCSYQVQYLSNGTSSSGVLVEDVLHLTTDDSREEAVDAQIPLGCGLRQTGSFLDGAAVNGLFGLGMANVSVPSVLASKGLAANSFSMCFGPDGIGRISFGDRGSSQQGETPFNVDSLHPTYNVSMTKVTVGDKVTDLSFDAIFDSGTSFTYLTDPAYSTIAENFNSQAQEKRRAPDSDIPFEYCYDLSESQVQSETGFETPYVNLTMKGGSEFPVADPIIIVSLQRGLMYCLALVKSEDINIIGQNFMTGYRIVFDREKMVLGWETADCYGAKNSNTFPVSPGKSGSVPSPTTVGPEATSGPNSGISDPSQLPIPANESSRLNSFAFTLLIAVLSVVATLL